MCALVYLVLHAARVRRLPARWGRQDLGEKSQGSRVGRPCFYSASLASVIRVWVWVPVFLATSVLRQRVCPLHT